MDRHLKTSLDILLRCLIIFLVFFFCISSWDFPVKIHNHCFSFSYHPPLRHALSLFSWSPPCKCWGLVLGTDAGSPKSHLFSSQISPCLLGQVVLLDQLGSHLLSSLQFKPRTGCSIYMRFHKCWAEGGNHFPQLPESVPDPTAQEAAGPHCCRGAMLSRSFWKSCSPATSSSPAEGYLPLRCRTSALILDEFYNVSVNPLLQPLLQIYESW